MTDRVANGERLELVQLAGYLNMQPQGAVADEAALFARLVPAWPALTGGEQTGMNSAKLFRLEHPTWHPPFLVFQMERHGAMVGGGSSRAELQEWTINIDSWRCDARRAGYRQVYPTSPRLNVALLATEVVSLVAAGADHELLNWRSADRDTVTIRVGKLIPDNGPKQTVTARRKRLARALCDTMQAHGWDPVVGTTANTFTRRVSHTTEPRIG